MPRKRKATWPPKFKTGLTSIARLRHYSRPLPMVGYPTYYSWGTRAMNLYEIMMEEKYIALNGGFTSSTYYRALDDNKDLDILIERKWQDYEYAMEDAYDMAWDEAQLENWNREYAIEWPGITA